MKHFVVTAILSSTLMAMPVMAQEHDSFFALKHIQAQQETVAPHGHQSVAKLTDQELSTVEGGDICLVCPNVAAAVNLALLNITGNDFTQTASTGSQLLQP
jgi:hypothetical protein